MKIALEEIRLSNRAPLSCNAVSVHGFLTRRHPSHAIAGGDTPDRGGSAGSVTANSSGRATLVAMAPTRALPPQDGHLMSRGDEFEFQRGAATNPEQEQGTEGGQKREHADEGMALARETLQLLGFLEF